MEINKAKYERFYWILLWLGVSAITWYLVELKYLALDFHTRDYAFYTEFIIKWSGPANQQYYSMNPGGYNFLGVRVVDGCNGFYQWVHLEPIRLVQAFIYKIFHSLHAVFIFNALVICSPVLLIPLWLNKASIGFLKKNLWVLFFIAFPATMLTAGYDNRPSMFLGVGYFWILYFLLATKNKWGQYISFLGLFCIREEALILNGIVCFYLFLKWRKREISADWFLLHLITLMAYGIALSCYFSYWNYQLFDQSDNRLAIWILLPAILGVIALVGYAWIKAKLELFLFLPVVLLMAQFGSMYLKGTFPDEKFVWYNDPRTLAPFLVLIAYLLYQQSFGKKRTFYVLLLGTLPMLIFSFTTSGGVWDKVSFWKNRYKETAVVFKYARATPTNWRIATDYSTHQAFIEYPFVYCLERLPCYMDKSAQRFYPENRERVISLLTKTSLVVVSKQTEDKMQPYFEMVHWDSSIATNNYSMFTRKIETTDDEN